MVEKSSFDLILLGACLLFAACFQILVNKSLSPWSPMLQQKPIFTSWLKPITLEVNEQQRRQNVVVKAVVWHFEEIAK